MADFDSLHQEPRTREEESLFSAGLSSLDLWYSAQFTTTFLLTSMPDGHAHLPSYHQRGWPSFELSVSSFVKDYTYLIDLGRLEEGADLSYTAILERCTGSRVPPQLPDSFARGLQSKRFSNQAADLPLVSQLQAAAFARCFSVAPRLVFSRLGWGDEEVAQLAEVGLAAAMPKCTRLELADSRMGDAGLAALATAVGRGAWPHLRNFLLTGNRAVGDAGLQALCDVAAGGALAELAVLRISGSSVGDEGLRALAAVLANGALPALTYLSLGDNKASDAARQDLRDACRDRPFTPNV